MIPDGGTERQDGAERKDGTERQDGAERKDGAERQDGAERKDGAERQDGTERQDQRSADREKPVKVRRAKAGGQQRTGVVPKRAAEDDPRTWGDAESGNDHDAWLKEQKPPHWG